MIRLLSSYCFFFMVAIISAFFSCLFILYLDFIVNLLFQVFSGILTDLIFFLKFLHLFPSAGDSCRLAWQHIWMAFPKFFLWWKPPTFTENLTASSIVKVGDFQSLILISLCCIHSLFWYVPTKHQQSLDRYGHHTSHVWMLCIAGWMPSHWSVALLTKRNSWCLDIRLYIALCGR